MTSIPEIETITDKILDYFFEKQNDPVFKGINIYIGAYLTADKSNSFERLLKEANDQIYKAKEYGKNKSIGTHEG